MLRFVTSSLLLTALFAWSPAFAAGPEVAPEWNFTSRAIHAAWKEQDDLMATKNEENAHAQKMFKNEVAKRCPECKITELKDRYGVEKFRVELESGWYFEITLDPGMVEITGKPITDIEPLAPKMKELIWDVAEKIKLHPGRAGHLNFGVESAFGKDSRLFHNFYADYLNHTGLAGGVFGYHDTANAPHPEELAAKPRKALQRVFTEFNPETQSIRDFASRLYHEVYYYSPNHGGIDGELPQKYQAANIVSIVNDKDTWPRLELRAIPMQSSPEELALWQKLFGARIEFLKKQEGLVPYSAHLRHGEITSTQMVEEFYHYVKESGLDWDEFKVLISKEARFQTALERFEKKLAEGHIKARACQSKFSAL